MTQLLYFFTNEVYYAQDDKGVRIYELVYLLKWRSPHPSFATQKTDEENIAFQKWFEQTFDFPFSTFNLKVLTKSPITV